METGKEIDEGLVRHAVRLLQMGRTRVAVTQDLVDEGRADRETAAAVTKEACSWFDAAREARERSKARLNRTVGAICLAIGLGLSLYSYLGARRGGMFVVCIGLVGFGLYTMLARPFST